jgi:hypothetical protein
MSESETSNGSTLSAADSPAKISATPDDAPESLRDSTARDSGESSNESFASYDPDSCSWRTSQHSLFGGLTLYSQTWPRSGSMRNGIAFRRPTLVPLTAEIGSGLWATPVANRSIGCTISAAQREATRLGASRWTLMTQVARELWRTTAPVADASSDGRGESAERTSGDGRQPERLSSARGEYASFSNWTTEPDVGRVADGISTHMDRLAGVPLLPASPHPKRKAAGRVHRLKALGNAVVPQAGEWIGWQIRRAIGDV